MAKRQKIEVEIEKHRNNGNWEPLREQAKLLATRVGKEDGAVVLLQCQLDFELIILRQNKKVKYDFEATLKSANFANDSKFEVQLESKLLLAWFYFHRERLDEAADVLQTLNITPSIPTQPYLARLTAVALAIKAVLTENGKSDSFSKLPSAKQTLSLRQMYESAAEQTVNFLRLCEENAARGVSPSSTIKPGSNQFYQDVNFIPHPIQVVFEKLPVFYENESTQSAIDCYRKYLKCVSSRLAPRIKSKLTLNCATLLLSKSNLLEYVKAPPDKSQLILVPETIEQEALLLLSIADNLKSQTEFVIDRSSEFDEERQESLNSAKTLFDLVTVTLARIRQYSLLSQKAELTMKLAFRDFYSSFQFALSLLNAKRYREALSILDECIDIREDPVALILAADTSFRYLHKPKQALQYLSYPAAKEHKRWNILSGMAFSSILLNSSSLSTRSDLINLAISHFVEDTRLNPNHSRSFYQLALARAKNNQISTSMNDVMTALRLDPENGEAFLLLQILHSIGGRKRLVIDGCKIGIYKWPHIMGFYTLGAKTLIQYGKEAEAVEFCRLLLEYAMNQDPFEEIEEESDGMSIYTSLTGLTQKTKPDEALSVAGKSAMHTESVLNDIESTLSGSIFKISDPGHAHFPLAMALYQTAELFVEMDVIDGATECVEEAQKLMKGNRKQVLFIKGLIAEKTDDCQEAIALLQDAISIDPSYFDALHKLGILNLRLNRHVPAEKCFRDCIGLKPLSATAWRSLGLLLEAKEEDPFLCFAKAAELEQFEPLLDFSNCPILL